MEDNRENNQLADEYYSEGRQAFNDGRLNEAAVLIQKAIQLYQKCGNWKQYVTAMNLMGVIYAAIGNETMAIDYYLEGLECAIDNQFRILIALFYNNIGSRYQELGEHRRAIEYFLNSVRELEAENAPKEKNDGLWHLITYLNLQTSYWELGEFDISYEYLQKAERYMTEEVEQTYHCTFLGAKCRLLWDRGEKEFVYRHLEELLSSAEHDENASDHVQNMKSLCSLLRDMGEYEGWKRIIDAFERYSKEQGTVYCRLILTEMQMEYYRVIGEMQRYIHLCVDHTELYQKQREIVDKERAAAIDIKIELRNKEAERRQAEAKSTTDALTGLGNRYLLENEAAKIFAEAAAKGAVISVGVLDIDYFKQHNDTYGHIQGDTCLQKVAEVLSEMAQGIGQVYRFGGDEFVMLLVEGESGKVAQIAESVKEGLARERIKNENSRVIPEITISQGYVCFVPKGDETAGELIKHADVALYHVKENGRNGYHIIEEV